MVMLRKFFTLIELLVVIAIIAILAGLIFPVFNKSRESAKRTYCQSNLKGIGASFEMYTQDYKGYMPVAAQLPSAHLNDYPSIAEVMSDYPGTQKCWKCPSDSKYWPDNGTSYEYRSVLGGRKLGTSGFGRTIGFSNILVMHDYEAFHRVGASSSADAENSAQQDNDTQSPSRVSIKKGIRNYLFADWHVES